MEVFLFSNSKKTVESFSALKKSKEVVLSIVPVADCKKTVKKIPSCVFLYFDISSVKKSEVNKMLKYISGIENQITGIIDPGGDVTGIASLFHNGLADYITQKELAKGINLQRIKKIITLRKCRLDDSEYDNISGSGTFITVNDGWDSVKPGNEYTFCIMYISLDHLVELKRNYGHLFMDMLIDRFTGFIESEMSKIGGRMWKWDDNEGILIFPYNGKECSAIESCFRFIRDKLFISMEKCNSPELLTYTIILHLGNLSYQPRGKTGTTISESINFIFHAGELISQKGRLYLTDTLFNRIPEPISDLFLPAGKFEGHELKRMKHLTYDKRSS